MYFENLNEQISSLSCDKDCRLLAVGGRNGNTLK
jgi:hypothetical protein